MLNTAKYEPKQTHGSNYTNDENDNFDFLDENDIFNNDYGFLDQPELYDDTDFYSLNVTNDYQTPNNEPINERRDNINFISQNNAIENGISSYDNDKSNNQSVLPKTTSLTKDVYTFKKQFYKIFSKKKFSKEIVKKIHNILRNHYCFRAMNRNEFRSINTYFENYAFHSDSILSFLKKNKNYIIESIPELKNHK